MLQNSYGEYIGELFIFKEGLVKFKNMLLVWLMKQLGSVYLVRELVYQMGIDKNKKYLNGRYVLFLFFFIFLGLVDLMVMEMIGVYIIFVNNGYYCKFIYILKIEDKNGKKIYEVYSNVELVFC